MASKDPPSGRKPKSTGRKNLKYVGIPVELWKQLKAFADQDERSVNWVAKKAIQEFLGRGRSD